TRFNRALCYRKMLLVGPARVDLNSVLSEEREPDWKAEVQTRIDEMRSGESKTPAEILSDLRIAEESADKKQITAILDRNFTLLFGYSLSSLVKAYLDSTAAGDFNSAGDSLKQIRLVGRAFSEEKHDSMIADAANYLEKLKKEEAAALLGPYNEYTAAKGLLSSYNGSGADSIFEHVRQSFHERGALTWESFSAYNLSTAYYEAGRCTDGIKVLEGILPTIQARSWPLFLIRTYYQLGIYYSLLGQDSIAINYCESALDVCRQSTQPDAKALQAVSIPYWHLGDLDRALDSLRRSTVHSVFVEPSPIDAANNYLNIADIYRQHSEHGLARNYGDEAVNFALRSGISYLVAESSSFLAVETATSGDTQEANRNLSMAFDALKKTTGGWRLYAEPLVFTRAGEVARLKGDFQGAIDAYSRAEAIASQAEGDASLVIDPLRGRARAYLAAGQLQKARSDLLVAIRMIENRRGAITDKTNRVHYLDSTQDVFDQLIALDMSPQVNKPPEAFSMAERSRARALLD